MASLRDVFDHIGKKVRVERADGSVAEGLGLLREPEAFAEAKLAPRLQETLVFLDGGDRFRIEESSAEMVRGRVDHYRLRVKRL